MTTVRPEGARRLGAIIGVVLALGMVTAIVRASRNNNDSGVESIRSGAPTTLPVTQPPATEPPATEPATQPAPTVPAPTTPATAAAAAPPPTTPATSAAPAPAPSNSGLSTSGAGAAATTQHPTTGGGLLLGPGLGVAAAGVLLRKKRSAFYRQT